MSILDPYVWLKWLHVLSSAVLLGAGIGTAFQLWSAHRNGSMRAIAVVIRTAVKADRRFMVPAAIILPVTGLGLVIVKRTPIDLPWLVASYALLVVAVFCGVWAGMLVREARPHAQHGAESGIPVRYAYHEAMKRWFVLVWPAYGALVLIFFLMSAKPGFG